MQSVTDTPETMRAIVINGVTSADEARLSEVPVPDMKPGWLLVRVRGFGLNHSEQMLRLGEVNEPYIAKPCVPGIECVGEVVCAGDTGFAPGQRVCALMGGMGREFWGGYAEYALVPAHHTFAFDERMSAWSWAELAALPETYHTAWGSLFCSLKLQAGETLLVRGATSALGYAAVQLARAFGARVVATTHRPERLGELRALLGAGDTALVDDGKLAARMREEGVEKALELVGAKTLRDTLRGVAPGGIVCNVGVLGGAETLEFDPIFDLSRGAYLATFYSNAPTPKGMADLFSFMVEHDLKPQVGACFDFDNAPRALRAQDAGGTRGKIVVVNE